MLHREDHNHHDVVEHRLLQFKKTLSAVFDHIHDEGEQTFSKVCILLEIVLDID